MTRVAGIDCGTNSIRLLVADCDPATGELVELDRRMIVVRLGQGVDKTGRLAPEALERTFAACREYAGVIKEFGAERVRFVATSASRDAENRDEFVRGVLDALGVEPEVISGDQEAEFSFTGATKELVAHELLQTPSGGPPWSARSWWWTSAAARPSSSSARTTCARPARSTWAASG